MDAEKRLLELLEMGCPKCGQKDHFDLDCTEKIRRRTWLGNEGYIEYGEAEYIETVSEDYILCPACYWQEPEE